MEWNKKQIATFATLAHMEGWVAKKNLKKRDEKIFDGSLAYLNEKANSVDRYPKEPERLLDLANRRKFEQFMSILEKVV